MTRRPLHPDSNSSATLDSRSTCTVTPPWNRKSSPIATSESSTPHESGTGASCGEFLDLALPIAGRSFGNWRVSALLIT